MISSNIKFIPKHTKQEGAALFTALVFLVVMTLLAITSMGTNTLEERMASNSQQINRSFQASEAGIRIIANDANALDDTSGNTNTTTTTGYGINDDITISSSSTYKQTTTTQRSSAASDASSSSVLYFDLSGSATTGGVDSALHSGMYREASGS